jgi:hypothetical protein
LKSWSSANVDGSARFQHWNQGLATPFPFQAGKLRSAWKEVAMDERVRGPQSPSEHRHTETATEARQGSLGRRVLYVLIGGLVLGAIYLIGTQIWNLSENPPAEPVDPPAISLPAEAPANPPPAAP